MSPARRPADVVRGLHQTLGTPGLMIAFVSLISFAFGLIVLIGEYNWLRDTGRETLRGVIAGWIRTLPVDYLGRTLADDADQWQRAAPVDRPPRLAALRRSLDVLGYVLERHAESFPLMTIVALDLGPRGGGPLAQWRLPSGNPPASLLDRVPVVPAGTGPAIELTAWYRLAPEVERAAVGLETSYHRLLLALLGLSGYSLLCLGYMMLHARALRDRVARESAQQATLDLADRTCHELGNIVFVLSNEERNLADHLDLVERFATEEPTARDAAARQVGLEPALADRFGQALRREYANRGIDPAVELLGSAAIARDVCRQIAVCSEYIALTVRELDSYLKQSSLPVTLGPVAVDACFNDALALLAPRLEAVGATIEGPGPASEQPLVLADRRLLVHALVNLLKNALEAAASAGVAPQISLSARAEGSKLWIAVADNGPGIPQADLRRIFDLDYSTKGAGRGRGLAIVRESVRAQRGELQVISRPGTGAELRIGLPVAERP